MGIFRQEKAIGDLRESMAELRIAVADLQSAHKRLSLEWEELYDKVRRQMARMSKRAAVDAKENGPLVTDVETGEEPQIDPVSAKILARRGFLRRQAE